MSEPFAPGETELTASYSRHLGPRFDAAGLRIQFHYNQEPGIHFRVPVSEEYGPAIVKGIADAMARRFPEFPKTGSIWILEVMEDPVTSSRAAFLPGGGRRYRAGVCPSQHTRPDATFSEHSAAID